MSLTIALTGASGAMGSAAVKFLLESERNHKLRLLLRDDAVSRKYARSLKGTDHAKLEIIYGDIAVKEDCDKLVKGADYVIHMAALIPPASDHRLEETKRTNYGGTVNIVEAIRATKPQPKFVYISSVAVYGNRNYLHPWGRVGDPLLPSTFDVYAATKVRAERYILDSDLENWAILRQTGILHLKMLENNMKDGLMFHTSWNAPLEWVTADDSGLLIRNLIEYDSDGKAPGFWKRVYNIGGGKINRRTGYDTFDGGFAIIGGSAESFLEPVWNCPRNFHGVWFSDSQVLEDYFHFRTETVEDYWDIVAKAHPVYAVAKFLPSKLIKKLAIERLLGDSNAPMRWVKSHEAAKVAAAFGSTDNIDLCPVSWEEYPLLSKGRLADGEIDYDALRDDEYARTHGYLLDHGYDETKPDSELDIGDMRSAASFRGGKCLSESMTKGDLYTKLLWECHDGHRFEASPYTVIKAGHWCPECCQPEPWKFDILAKSIPFFAQVWYDSHARGENGIYYYKNDKAVGFRMKDGMLCRI